MHSAWDLCFWACWVVLGVCVVIRVMADCPELAPVKAPKAKRPTRAKVPELVGVAHA